ncbi:HtaA domain-containing protein [uncultured Amnibacterium sp.]|uniref:HtaA domain-containing protein n=1 Tax=uncultured Amnibacterium sp. TaxID=1631851 RepID=UPI0035C9C028
MLRWGVKGSFLRYVERSGPSRIAGYRGDPDGPFEFEWVSREDGTERFDGEIDITAHGGMLRLHLRDPWLRSAASGTGVLSFDVVGDERQDVLDLVPAERDGEWAARLTTAAGTSDLFGGYYTAGTVMDAVFVE